MYGQGMYGVQGPMYGMYSYDPGRGSAGPSRGRGTERDRARSGHFTEVGIMQNIYQQLLRFCSEQSQKPTCMRIVAFTWHPMITVGGIVFSGPQLRQAQLNQLNLPM